jgi:hypothetical protein
MNRGHTPVHRVAALAFTLLVGTGCASGGGTAQGPAINASSAGAFPLPKGDAPALGALPGLSTYAWVPPSFAFTGLTPLDDERAMAASGADLRDASSAVLRANGWRETSADSASFLLALIDVEQVGMRSEKVPDPRGEMPQPSVCANLSPAQKQVCREPPPRRYPPIDKMMPYRDHRVAFAIVRVHDQARRTWLVNITDMNSIARGTVNLLKAQAP